MPITYEIDGERSLIRTHCVGDVTFEEVLGHFRELEADDSLPSRADVLLDLTGMVSLPDKGQLQSVAAELGRLWPTVTWGAFAMVADRDVLYGMIRMLQVFADDEFEVSSVFREREAAELWLASRPARST